MNTSITVKTPIVPKGDLELADALAIYRACKAQLADVEAELKPAMNAARARIQELLAERGENYEDEDGYARMREGYERVSYDTGTIDTVAFSLSQTVGEANHDVVEIDRALETGDVDLLHAFIHMQRIAANLIQALSTQAGAIASARKVSQVSGGAQIK